MDGKHRDVLSFKNIKVKRKDVRDDVLTSNILVENILMTRVSRT